MRYAVIADIHANLPALRVVLEDIKAQQCSRIVCLGDLVGYNSYPKECLDIIRELDIPCVKGNHDEYCSSDVPLEGRHRGYPRQSTGVASGFRGYQSPTMLSYCLLGRPGRLQLLSKRVPRYHSRTGYSVRQRKSRRVLFVGCSAGRIQSTSDGSRPMDPRTIERRRSEMARRIALREIDFWLYDCSRHTERTSPLELRFRRDGSGGTLRTPDHVCVFLWTYTRAPGLCARQRGSRRHLHEIQD